MRGVSYDCKNVLVGRYLQKMMFFSTLRVLHLFDGTMEYFFEHGR